LSTGLRASIERAWLSRGLLSTLLLPVSWLYAALSSLNRSMQASAAMPRASLRVPVIVVGNLIAGGAGKTPTVMAVVTLLRSRGYMPGIVSRGHGRSDSTGTPLNVEPDTPADRSGDEPLLLRLRTGAPVCVATDRWAAAQHLLATHPAVDVIVSDDGLQHVGLPRTAQVVVFDERGVGNSRQLPAGPLREGMTAAAPARSVVVYNADRQTTPWPGHIGHRRLIGIVDLAAWWAGQSAKADALKALAAARGPVFAAAGVARPSRFFDMLRDAGLAVHERPLPDHDRWTTVPWPADARDVVITEKDAVKLRPERLQTLADAPRVWVAPLDFVVDAAFADELMALLPKRLLPSTQSSAPAASATPPSRRHDGHSTA
jgi:tetraacyldisaccharide 4'-kinase